MRGRVLGRDPVRRIKGRLIFALGGKSVATGVDGEVESFVRDAESGALIGFGVVDVLIFE